MAVFEVVLAGEIGVTLQHFILGIILFLFVRAFAVVEAEQHPIVLALCDGELLGAREKGSLRVVGVRGVRVCDELLDVLPLVDR